VRFVPNHYDKVAIEGRTGEFWVIGIDAMHETVHVRTGHGAVAFTRNVPWSALSLIGPKTLSPPSA
jgi:hypothetical protein